MCINVGSVPLPTHLHSLQVFSPPLPSQPHREKIGFLETTLSYHGGQCLSQLLQVTGSTSSKVSVSLVATPAGSRWQGVDLTSTSLSGSLGTPPTVVGAAVADAPERV